MIGPGNANGSRFYHRLVDTTVGMRMPPTGPLVPDQIRILKAWIDEGADWPDELAGDRPLPPVNADAERLAHLIREGNRTAANDQLRARPNVVRSRTSGGSTPLMFAALYGDADLVRTLLASGADPNVADAAGATALMWAVPDVARMTALLDAGADVNALSDNRRSPLVIAAGIVRSTPAVTLLLDYGADPSPRLASDPSALVRGRTRGQRRGVSIADGVRRGPAARYRRPASQQLFRLRSGRERRRDRPAGKK